MNLGILGTGSIARTMAAEFAKVPAFHCAAVCSRQKATGEALARSFGIPKVYTDYDAMLTDPDIELVYIATPNSLHYAQTKAALLAGKNVLCEKPMATSAAEAEAMLDAAKKAGKHLQIGFVCRFGEDCKVVEDLRDNGFFGDLYYATGTMYLVDWDIPADTGTASTSVTRAADGIAPSDRTFPVSKH